MRYAVHLQLCICCELHLNGALEHDKAHDKNTGRALRWMPE